MDGFWILYIEKIIKFSINKNNNYEFFSSKCNNNFTHGYRKISVGKSSEITKLVSLRVMEYT